MVRAASVEESTASRRDVRDGGFATIRRQWETGDRAFWNTSMERVSSEQTTIEWSSRWLYGPIVLAA
jgi:hypothetical protein